MTITWNLHQRMEGLEKSRPSHVTSRPRTITTRPFWSSSNATLRIWKDAFPSDQWSNECTPSEWSPWTSEHLLWKKEMYDMKRTKRWLLVFCRWWSQAPSRPSNEWHSWGWSRRREWMDWPKQYWGTSRVCCRVNKHTLWAVTTAATFTSLCSPHSLQWFTKTCCRERRNIWLVRSNVHAPCQAKLRPFH